MEPKEYEGYDVAGTAVPYKNPPNHNLTVSFILACRCRIFGTRISYVM